MGCFSAAKENIIPIPNRSRSISEQCLQLIEVHRLDQMCIKAVALEDLALVSVLQIPRRFRRSVRRHLLSGNRLPLVVDDLGRRDQPARAGIMEEQIKRVARGRYVLIPLSDRTRFAIFV